MKKRYKGDSGMEMLPIIMMFFILFVVILDDDDSDKHSECKNIHDENVVSAVSESNEPNDFIYSEN